MNLPDTADRTASLAVNSVGTPGKFRAKVVANNNEKASKIRMFL